MGEVLRRVIFIGWNYNWPRRSTVHRKTVRVGIVRGRGLSRYYGTNITYILPAPPQLYSSILQAHRNNCLPWVSGCIYSSQINGIQVHKHLSIFSVAKNTLLWLTEKGNITKVTIPSRNPKELLQKTIHMITRRKITEKETKLKLTVFMKDTTVLCFSYFSKKNKCNIEFEGEWVHRLWSNKLLQPIGKGEPVGKSPRHLKFPPVILLHISTSCPLKSIVSPL